MTRFTTPPTTPSATPGGTEIRPFTFHVDQSAVDELTRRLERAIYPHEIADSDATYGVPISYVRRLAERWRTGYDWHALEASLNAHPQFTTTIDGQNIHFLHVTSPEPDATPLILTHGWPGSIVEYLDVVGPLSDPRSHGGDPANAFHLVIPSLPGFALSGPTTEPGWNRYRTAAAWVELMSRLGYERFGAVGNDGGSFVSPEVGRIAPDRVLGVHVTQIFSFPSGDPAEFERLTDDDRAALDRLQWFEDTMSAFNKIHAQQPQTLAYALADSPLGTLAWNAQLFGADAVDDQFVLDNVTLYWLTGTEASSIRFYFEDAHATQSPAGPTTVPIGLAQFGMDFHSIRTFAERDHRDIRSWNVYDVGGHYAAHQVPGVFVHDVRGFFAALS